MADVWSLYSGNRVYITRSQEKYFPQPAPLAFQLLFAYRKTESGKFSEKLGIMDRAVSDELFSMMGSYSHLLAKKR